MERDHALEQIRAISHGRVPGGDKVFDLACEALNGILSAQFSCFWDVAASTTAMMLQSVVPLVETDRKSAVVPIDADHLTFLDRELTQPIVWAVERLDAYLFRELTEAHGVKSILCIPFRDTKGELVWHAYSHLVTSADETRSILTDNTASVQALVDLIETWWHRRQSDYLAALLRNASLRVDRTDPIPSIEMAAMAAHAQGSMHLRSRAALQRPLQTGGCAIAQAEWQSRVMLECSETCSISVAAGSPRSAVHTEGKLQSVCRLHEEATGARESQMVLPLRQEEGGDRAAGVFEWRDRTAQTHLGNEVTPFSRADVSMARFLAPGLTMLAHTVLVEQRLGDIMSDTVHECASPMNAIRDNIMFLRNHPTGPHATRRRLNDIISICRIVSRQLATLDLFDPSELELSQEPTLLFETAVDIAVQEVEFLAKQRQFHPERIVLHGRTQLPKLFVDPELMIQVFYNLLANSIKYAYDDPGAFNVTIDVERVEGGYEVGIADTGIGMNERDRLRIFERGYRSIEAIRSIGSGKGLGLAIVRVLLEAHGASIELRNLRHPTRFVVRFPDSLVVA